MTAPPPVAGHSSRPRIVVAGLGLLTPLGHSVWETFTALLAGRTLAEPVRVGRLAEGATGSDLVRALGGVSVVQHAASDPAIDLAERAAREAIFESGGVHPHHLPTFLGTSKGAVKGLTDACEALRQATGDRPTGSPRHFAQRAHAVALGPHGHLAQQLQHRLGTPVHRHVVAACASSLTALHAARDFLLHAPGPAGSPQRSGDSADHALVVTADAALLPSFVYSYRRLGVLAPLDAAGYRQRPLDARRSGFMLSECGAAVLLKRLAPGEAPEIGQIELLDTAIAAETHDLIRPSPTMPALRHVAHQLLTGRHVDVLHPHTPGTADHDPTELAVYGHVLDDGTGSGPRPDLYACKGALGHSLGAAGLAALVLACMTLRTGRRPPMPWLTQPMAEAHGFDLAGAADGRPCSRRGTHAVLAAGFAGHVAGAVLQRH